MYPQDIILESTKVFCLNVVYNTKQRYCFLFTYTFSNNIYYFYATKVYPGQVKKTISLRKLKKLILNFEFHYWFSSPIFWKDLESHPHINFQTYIDTLIYEDIIYCIDFTTFPSYHIREYEL